MRRYSPSKSPNFQSKAQQFFYLHLDVHPKDLCFFEFLDLRAESMYNLVNNFGSIFEVS
jgi:hypothetical protein